MNITTPIQTLPKRNVRPLGDGLAATMLWFISGSPIVATGARTDFYLLLFLMFFLIYGFSNGYHFGHRARPFVPLIFAFILWTVLVSLNGDWSQWYSLAGHLIKISLVIIFVSVASRPIESLVSSMVGISIIALAIFIVRQCINFLSGYDIADLFQSIYPLTGALPDRSIGIFNFDIPREFSRNAGLFREPGLFATYLAITILLIASPLHRESYRRKLLNVLILSAALISTQSTTGLIALPLLFALFILLSSASHKSLIILLVFGTTLICFSVFLWMFEAQRSKIDYQLSIFQSQSNTWYQSRIGNAYVDWLAAQERPLLGYGFSEADRPRLWFGMQEQGFGNGLTGTFVKFGFPLTLTIYISLVSGLFRLFRNFAATGVGILIVLILLFGQQLLTLPLIYTLLASYAKRLGSRDSSQNSHSGILHQTSLNT